VREEVDAILKEAKARMAKAVEVLAHDLASIRTGRASPALVENIRVDYYGTPTPLKQLATITTPEARLIVIQPWDRSLIKAIEKAIQQSDLGVIPTDDGTVIRIALPPLSEERRRELAKVVRQRVEQGRVAVRNVRRDAHDHLRRLEREHKLSEDEFRRAEQELQRLTDSFIKEVDQLGEAKEEEVLQV